MQFTGWPDSVIGRKPSAKYKYTSIYLAFAAQIMQIDHAVAVADSCPGSLCTIPWTEQVLSRQSRTGAHNHRIHCCSSYWLNKIPWSRSSSTLNMNLRILFSRGFIRLYQCGTSGWSHTIFFLSERIELYRQHRPVFASFPQGCKFIFCVVSTFTLCW